VRKSLQGGRQEDAFHVAISDLWQCKCNQTFAAVAAYLADGSLPGKHTPEKLPMIDVNDSGEMNREHFNVRLNTLERSDHGYECVGAFKIF